MHRHAIPDIELRAKLAERGLECHLLVADGISAVDFPSALCASLQPLLQAARRWLMPTRLQPGVIPKEGKTGPSPSRRPPPGHRCWAGRPPVRGRLTFP